MTINLNFVSFITTDKQQYLSLYEYKDRFEMAVYNYYMTYWQVFLWSCHTGLVVSEPLGSLPGQAGNLFPLQGNASVPGVMERFKKTHQHNTKDNFQRGTSCSPRSRYINALLVDWLLFGQLWTNVSQ